MVNYAYYAQITSDCPSFLCKGSVKKQLSCFDLVGFPPLK